MKIAILDARQGENRKAENSYTVAYRNMIAIKEKFKADLMVSAKDIPDKNDYDVIICGFGSTSCEKEKSTEFLIKNKNARIFWLVGEYEQSTFAPLFYSKRKFEVIKNFEHHIRNQCCIGQHFININTLLARESNPEIEKKYGLVYYGRWRPDRLDYFRQYLDSCVYLSTHSKNIKMFHHNGCNPRLIKPMTWKYGRETLNLFSASLYIEDRFTHHNYNCLANRFYEALFCNVVPLFDRSCAKTLSRSGLKDYEWHMISNTCEAMEKLSRINHCVIDRVREWNIQANKEKEYVLGELERIFRG